MALSNITPELEIIEKDNVIGLKKDTPIELNLIQSAMFSKNKNAVKSKELTIDHLDILIRAVKGHTIPNAFDEDVFFAILHLLVKFKDIWRLEYIPRTIFLTYTDLCATLKLGTQYIDRIRTSLDKLASTSYKFTNTFLYRDISCSVLDYKELSDEDIELLRLDNSVIIHGDNVYNDRFDVNKHKLKSIIHVESEKNLKEILAKVNLSKESKNQNLNQILQANPISDLVPDIKKYREHYLNVFSDFVIANSQSLVDDEELLSSIRHEINGNKITDFKVKRNSVTSTFNLINFIEFKTEEITVGEMIKDAKLTKDTYTAVKSFLENKINGRTKYMLRIDINNYTYENIINKVYLLHSLDYLLDFTDKTARAIYLFIESSKGYMKRKNKGIIRLSNPNYIIVDASILAQNIPISMSDKQISSTINILLRSLDYLKNNGYIKNYICYREKPLRYSYFNIEFFHEQNRKHPEFAPYSIKVLPMLENNAEDNKESDIPEEISKIVNSIPGVTTENIDSLVTLYNDNAGKQASYKNKTLESNLGLLMIKAIAEKINLNSGKIKTLSGYLYHAINHPEVYAEQLEGFKNIEYENLYGKKFRVKKEKVDREQALTKEQAELKDQQNNIRAKWALLSGDEQEKYHNLAKKYSNKKIPDSLKTELPIHLYSLDIGLSYDPKLRFFIN
jgi:hypothetical protein